MSIVNCAASRSVHGLHASELVGMATVARRNTARALRRGLHRKCRRSGGGRRTACVRVSQRQHGVISYRPSTARRPSSMARTRGRGSRPTRSASHERSTSSRPSGTATESFGRPVTAAVRSTLPASPARSRFDVRGTTCVCHTSTPSTSSEDTTTQGRRFSNPTRYSSPAFYHGAEHSIRWPVSRASAALASAAHTKIQIAAMRWNAKTSSRGERIMELPPFHPG